MPDYPKLAQIWWQQIGDVNSGAFTPQEAMDALAGEMDDIMARMQQADEQANVYGGCGPRLNPEVDPAEWLGKPDGPKAKLENEKPQGETVNYDELVKRWAEASAASCPPARPTSGAGSPGGRDSRGASAGHGNRSHDPRTAGGVDQARRRARRHPSTRPA